MMTLLASPQMSGKRPGKQIREGLRPRGSKRIRDADTFGGLLTRSLKAVGNDGFGALPTPKVAARPLLPASCCFPHASPVSQSVAGKQKTAPMDRFKPLISLKKSGAGEGISNPRPQPWQGCARR